MWPKAETDNIVIDVTGHDERLDIIETDRDADTGTILLAVFGNVATPADKPNGDTTIVAKKNGVVKGSVQAIVVVPTGQVHVEGNPILLNTSVVIPAWGTNFSTRGIVFIDIWVKDQFGNNLHSVYDGENVVEEEFVNQGGDLKEWPPKGPIVEPDNLLQGGRKHDVSSDQAILAAGGHFYPPALLEQWAAFTWTPYEDESDNVFQGNTVNKTYWADQKIWVHGHLLGQTHKRTQKIRPVKRVDMPFTVDDE